MARRYQNRGETVAEIPLDYGMRWDASDKSGIGYLTDQATNDVNSWADQTGTLTLDSISGTGTYPAYLLDSDGLPHVRFYATRALWKTYDAAYDGATDMTVFAVTRSDSADQLSASNRYLVGGPGEFHISHQNGTSNPPGTLYDGSFYNPTNDFDDRRVIFVHRNVYNGAADNDADIWCGDTNIHTETTGNDADGIGYVTMGGYSTGTTWQCDGKVYEYVVFLRALTDAEIAAWVDYLSAKWQASNVDAASDTVSTSTKRTWVSDYVDPEGKSLTGYTPINHRVEGLPNSLTTARRGSPSSYRNDKFPILIPNLQTWYRSDHTGGMTFETGDAISGGTISAFTDITGSITLDKTTAGTTNFPTFHPSGKVRGGFPSIEGGDDTTNAGIEKNAPAADTSNTQQRILWSVGTFGDATKLSSWGGPMNNILFGGTYNAMSSDMVAKPAISYLGSATSGINYLIANGGPPADNGDIHIFVWRVTINGTNGDVESWYSGLKLPDRVSSSVDAGSMGQAIGLLATGNFDANGAQFLEMGCAYSTTATIQKYTDAHVESLIRYLCDRYDVSYMPENAPITIGCWSRQTASNALTDCCLWYDPSTIGASRWALHPNVAQYHTTPANFDLVTGAEATAVPLTLSSGVNGFESVSSDETTTANQHMESANSYSSTETTDFPADTDGMSTFVLMNIDSATTSSSGARTGNQIVQCRPLGTSDTTLQHLASNASKNHANSLDKWLIVGASYAYDDDGTGVEGYPGSTDGGPGAYYYANDDAMQSAAAPAAASFAIETWINWDVADGVANAQEFITYKHPLTIEEINELRKYFIHKYNNNFDFTNIQAHHVDENTVAHWPFEADALDDTGNKGAFNSGTFVAGSNIYNPYKFGYHDHSAQTTGFSYTSFDGDFDKHGAFTWCAAIYYNAYPASNPGEAFVRSSPPSGGTGSTNNIRYRFEPRVAGNVRYIHQYDTKVSEEYTTTATLPLSEWVYIGISRSADGTSGRIIINDTIEEWSGFTAPNNGGNARFEMLENWNGVDFDGSIKTAIFKSVESSPGELLAMKNQVFPYR